MSFTSPLLGSSPPAKTGSWPIHAKGPRGGLSKGLSTVARGAAADVPEQRRLSSEAPAGPRQASFSFSRSTPFATSAASTPSQAGLASRPPLSHGVPASRPGLRVEGFSAPAVGDTGAGPGTAHGSSSSVSSLAMSPGKLATKSSLLTASLLEPAERTLSSELFGAVAPAQGFQVGARGLGGVCGAQAGAHTQTRGTRRMSARALVCRGAASCRAAAAPRSPPCLTARGVLAHALCGC
jgi:hypothetical protein